LEFQQGGGVAGRAGESWDIARDLRRRGLVASSNDGRAVIARGSRQRIASRRISRRTVIASGRGHRIVSRGIRGRTVVAIGSKRRIIANGGERWNFTSRTCDVDEWRARA
jgi:hypothetical protein